MSEGERRIGSRGQAHRSRRSRWSRNEWPRRFAGLQLGASTPIRGTRGMSRNTCWILPLWHGTPGHHIFRTSRPPCHTVYIFGGSFPTYAYRFNPPAYPIEDGARRLSIACEDVASIPVTSCSGLCRMRYVQPEAGTHADG